MILIVLVPFCVESPRWLILHGKEEQALKNLDRIRPQSDVDNGLTVMEIQSLDQANKEALANKSRWIELLSGTYPRRIMVSAQVEPL